MGEYGKFVSREVKIGTCGDMLYLRAEHADWIDPLPGNVRPVADALGIRFRFPFPDEDMTEPGEYSDPFRSVGLYGVEVPAEGVDHYSVQFKDTGNHGLLVSLPCPESPEGRDASYKVHRNGYSGPVRISQQRVWEGRLVLVAECGSCGAKYRYPTLEDAQPVLDALDNYATSAARSDDESRAVWYRTIADRILAGYTDPPAWIVAAFEGVNA
jgi:hypothetical protein